jgi:hypothetical protein
LKPNHEPREPRELSMYALGRVKMSTQFLASRFYTTQNCVCFYTHYVLLTVSIHCQIINISIWNKPVKSALLAYVLVLKSVSRRPVISTQPKTACAFTRTMYYLVHLSAAQYWRLPVVFILCVFRCALCTLFTINFIMGVFQCALCTLFTTYYIISHTKENFAVKSCIDT